MRRLTHLIHLIWVVALVSSLVACDGSQGSGAAKPSGEQPRAAAHPSELKVGAAFTLSGDLAYWSEQIQKGMDLALDELNSGEATPVRVVYEDVQGNAQTAVSAFQKLDSVDDVSVVVSVFTPISQPLRVQAATAQLPLLATVTSAHEFAKDEAWSYRDFLTQEQMGAKVGRHAAETMGLTAAAGLVVDDDYGRDGATEFQKAFEAAGGKWLTLEVYKQSDTVMRPQVAKIAAVNPDTVLVVGRGQSLGLSIRQLREGGFDGQILSVNCLDSQKVWEIAGSAAHGAVFASALVDFEGEPAAKAFRQRYIARYGAEPDWVGVYGYTIMTYLAPILRNAHGDRTQVRDALAGLDVGSIRGRIHVNEAHDVLSPVGLYQLAGDQKHLISAGPSS